MDRFLVRGHDHRRGAAHICNVQDTVHAQQQSFACLCLAPSLFLTVQGAAGWIGCWAGAW